MLILSYNRNACGILPKGSAEYTACISVSSFNCTPDLCITRKIIIRVQRVAEDCVGFD